MADCIFLQLWLSRHLALKCLRPLLRLYQITSLQLQTLCHFATCTPLMFTCVTDLVLFFFTYTFIFHNYFIFIFLSTSQPLLLGLLALVTLRYICSSLTPLAFMIVLYFSSSACALWRDTWISALYCSGVANMDAAGERRL